MLQNQFYYSYRNKEIKAFLEYLSILKKIFRVC